MPGSRPLVPAQGVAFLQQPCTQPSRKEVISGERINPARRIRRCRRLSRVAVHGPSDLASDPLPPIRIPPLCALRGAGNPHPHYRPRPMAHQAMNYPPDPRRWCPMSNAVPHININLPEANARNDNARHIIAGCAAAMPTLADMWRSLSDALDDTLALAAEITRLSAELGRTRL